jgi:deoxycytidylate deaminase
MIDYKSGFIKEKLQEALSQKEVCKKHPISCLVMQYTPSQLRAPDRTWVYGWNGSPSGIMHDECNRKDYPSGQGLELCPTIHAERRAISRAAMKGISTYKSTIYLSEWFPCADCAKSIIEAGIKRLVTPDEFYQDKESHVLHVLIPKLQKQPYNFEMAEQLMREAGIEMIVDPEIRP